MATVLNKTTLQVLYSVNTPDYPENEWIINPDLSPLVNIPQKYWKVQDNNIAEMTSEEKAVVDSNELEQLKLKKISELDLATRHYITSKYALERQSSLQLLRGDARAEGKTNRFNYINQVVTWVNSVLLYHYTLLATIGACTTEEQLAQITWNHAANSLPDPEIAIQTAMGIPD